MSSGRVPLLHLRDWRLQAFLSQVDLAKAAGLTQGTISELETGKSTANFKTVKKLCQAFGITAQQLVYEGPPDSKRAAEKLRQHAGNNVGSRQHDILPASAVTPTESGSDRAGR
jgi:DNA-binding XRE family transcriptional regulator